MYDDGMGFVPDELVPGARTLVVLQNPGSEEERRGKPAIGATGDELNGTYLPKAGLTRGVDVSVANALRCRARGPNGKRTNKLPSGSTLASALEQCRIHDRWAGHDLVVASGAAALSAVGGTGKVSEWRGFLAPVHSLGAGTKVLITLHPADLFRDPKMRLPVLQDWRKVAAVRLGNWPLAIPHYFRYPGESDGVAVSELVHTWVAGAVAGAPFVVADTEYARDTKYLTTLGLGYPGAPGLQLWFTNLDPVDRAVIRDQLRYLFSRVTTVFQNTFADVPVLERNLGIKYTDYCRIEDTMLQHAVLWSEWPHTLEFLASMYGKYPKMKHLAQTDPSMYNWGDVLETMSAYEALQKEFRHDPLARAVYTTQSLPLVPILLERMGKGIRVAKPRVEPAREAYRSTLHAATVLARSCTGWPLNLGSEKQLKQYLYGACGYPVQYDKDTRKPSIDGDAIASLRAHVGPPPDIEQEEEEGLTLQHALDRIEAGADAVLEARVIYAAAQQTLSHYIKPLYDGSGRIRDRIHPQFKIHAQASGRWSTTDPPLAQLPKDLRDIICPDPGEVWIQWDWDQIELRLLAALANDAPYLEAFANGQDVHALNACSIFGPATGVAATDDLRRTFAKRFVYRLNYGGDPKLAGDIPGARQLGLGKADLVRASNRYLAAHPAMAAWRIRTAADARTTQLSRTFMGRRRRLLSGGKAAEREAYNHPMQGGVADILNLVTVEIKKRLPEASLVYTMHDAATWGVPRESVGALAVMKEVATRQWNIGGIDVSFPAKFKEPIYGEAYEEEKEAA
jgi:uracil-DNA glycosylase family 4